MPITLQLTPDMIERAQELATQHDTDVSAFLSQVVAEYLEEQDDIAYAKERLALIRSGKVKPLTKAEMEAKLRGE